MIHRLFSGFSLFGKAYRATHHEIWVSLKVLAIITIIFAIAMFLAERSSNPDYSFWDALVWTFVKYVEDPADIAEAPVTMIGKIVGTLVGVLGIAIFAVPAGLIGSGMMDAMSEDKREEELAGFRRRMQKAFRRSSNKGLREYLDKLPDGGGKEFKALNIVPQCIPIAKMQVRQGMDMKDIIDTCKKFPEFRLKNLADAHSAEDDAEDRFVVEHFPLNRKYGCCIQRNSKVTIICTTSSVEVGIGWFTYYLAKMGGFNYISKELYVDPDEPDSFYNLSPEPLYDKKPLSDYDKKKDNEAIEILKQKQEHRDEFFGDLKMINGGSWVIIIAEHLKTKDNQVDFHFEDCLKDGSASTVSDQDAFMRLFEQLTEVMKNDFSLTSMLQSPRYPLLKKNLGYKIRKDIAEANVFVLRPSSELMNFNDRKLAIAYRMASIISQQLDGGRGILPKDVKDFKETGFGYGIIEELNVEDGTAKTTL
jgi:voltage-gated potassium channel